MRDALTYRPTLTTKQTKQSDAGEQKGAAFEDWIANQLQV